MKAKTARSVARDRNRRLRPCFRPVRAGGCILRNPPVAYGMISEAYGADSGSYGPDPRFLRPGGCFVRIVSIPYAMIPIPCSAADAFRSVTPEKDGFLWKKDVVGVSPCEAEERRPRPCDAPPRPSLRGGGAGRRLAMTGEGRRLAKMTPARRRLYSVSHV
jgi:hypothetical protein